MATEVPSGMRSMAARNRHVMDPVVTPNPIRAGTSRRRIDLRAGRAITRKITAPAVRRSQAVPAGPTREIRGIDKAEPSCTLNIAVTARDRRAGGSVGVSAHQAERRGFRFTEAPFPARRLPRMVAALVGVAGRYRPGG